MFRQMLYVVTLAFTCAVVLAPSPAGAQTERERGPGGPDGPGGFGGPFGGGGMLGLVVRDEVQQELQLVDEQRDKLMAAADELRDKAREEMRGMFEEMRDLSDEERRERFGEIRTRFEKINADMEAELKKSLLPHQFERLKQIDLQARMQRGGTSALTSGEVGDALALTDEQREKLEQRAAEVREELQGQIRQLQADARKKVLDVLTSEQRAKLEKLMGAQFNLPEPDFGGFRGRFGRGGRDGDGDRGRPGGRAPRSGNETI